MHAAVLRDFLAGRAGSLQLLRDLGEVAELPGEPLLPFDVLDEPFDLFPRHLLALCEAVELRDLEPAVLSRVSRVLAGSGSFRWTRTDPDGRVVEEVLVEWSRQRPADLDPELMPIFRDWLVTRRRPERFGSLL